MTKPSVIVFNSLLLPPSQTFIRAQGEKLKKFTAYYLGSRRVEGLSLPAERTFVLNPGSLIGKCSEVLFKLTGRSPQLYQQIKQLKPELIHAQFGLSGALMLSIARSLSLPLVVHFRGADATIREEHARYSSINHWLYFRKQETLKRQAKLFLTVSEFIRVKLLEQGFPPDKVLTHYHGVDVNQFCADPDIPRQPVVLFVGRLTAKKGCQHLINAIAQVQAAQPDIKLVLIGDGPLRDELEAMAKQSLTHYEFLGMQSPDVVRSWMNKARLLAAPSVTSAQGDSEGLPNVVLEAMAMGLPIVGTLHAGIPEAVIHGETGFLVPERDETGLAEISLKILENPDLWQRFSREGRTHVETHFDRDRQTRRLERIYDAVLSEATDIANTIDQPSVRQSKRESEEFESRESVERFAEVKMTDEG